jgi:CubicO group peptidase (beta-lactamase class C family)
VTALDEQVRGVASSSGFSGAVRVRRHGVVELDAAFGMADRAHGVGTETTTRFAMASGSKAFTALAVMRLVETGALQMSTPVRALLGDDLQLIDDRVTVEHLLAHRSGIGDYLDEDLIEHSSDYVMTRAVHELTEVSAFLAMLEGHQQRSEPGTQFTYNNGGYMVLALVAERVCGRSYHELIDELVVCPAGLTGTAFLRSDELPGDAARGYLFEIGLRSNVFHLPVLGSGDGGLYTTLDDVDAFWDALFGGRIVSAETVAEMISPRSVDGTGTRRYGLGFWLHASNDTVLLEGADAGVSFRAAHRPSTGTAFTVLSNWSDGAWPVARLLAPLIDD